MRVSMPPVWELVLTILATYALTGVDRPRPAAAQRVAAAPLPSSRPRGAPTQPRPVRIDAGVGPSEGEPCSDASRRDPADRARLALRNIEDNLCFTSHEAWAWFVLPTQPWAFRSDRQREQLLFGFGDALAWLAGHRLHLRVTSRPYPTAEWARRLHRADARPAEHARGRALDRAHGHDAEAPAAPDHGREGGLPRRPAREPRRRPPADRRACGGTRATSSTRGCCRKVERVTETVALPGLEGRPATAARDGVAAAPVDRARPAGARRRCPRASDGDWDADDLHSFADSGRVRRDPARPHRAG